MPSRTVAFTAQHLEAAALVFQGESQREVARRMGVSEAAVRRWAKRPEWTAHMAMLEANAVEDTIARLRRLVGRATSRLEGVLDKPTADDNDTLRAVFGLYDRIGLGPHSFEHQDPGTLTVEQAEEAILKRAEAIRARRGAGVEPEPEGR